MEKKNEKPRKTVT